MKTPEKGEKLKHLRKVKNGNARKVKYEKVPFPEI